MALNVKPLGDRVLVEPVEEKEVKKGGIIIPDTAKEKPQEGIIRALGTGKTDDDGKKVPFEVKVGDRVLVSKYGGTRNQTRRQGVQAPRLGRPPGHPRITTTVESINYQQLTITNLWQQNNYFSMKPHGRPSCAGSPSSPAP